MKWLVTLATTIALTVPAVAASQTKKHRDATYVTEWRVYDDGRTCFLAQCRQK
jgi:hypothetical protein